MASVNNEDTCFISVSTENAEHYTWGKECAGWFLVRHKDFHIIQERMPPGSAEVMHFHQNSRQLFYVLRGVLTMSNASAAIRIAAGHAVLIEPKLPHRATNQSTEDVEFLVISCPPSHGDRVDCTSELQSDA